MSKVIKKFNQYQACIVCNGVIFYIDSDRSKREINVYNARKRRNTIHIDYDSISDTFRFATLKEQQAFFKELCNHAERWLKFNALQLFVNKYLRRSHEGTS